MVAQATLITIGPTAAPVKVSGGTAIQAGSEVIAESTGAAILYGINMPNKADQDHYAVVYGDGATKIWTEANIPCLGNANFLTGSANTAAATLGCVVLVNGTPILRVGSDASAGAGAFEIADDGSVGTLTVGSTYAAGTKIEFICGQTIAAQTILVANTPAEREAYDIMTAVTAAAVIYC